MKIVGNVFDVLDHNRNVCLERWKARTFDKIAQSELNGNNCYK